MASQNIPISLLPVAIGLDGSELVPIVQGGVSKRTTVTMIAGETTGFVPLTRRINTVNGIAGGGTLEDDLTLKLDLFSLTQKTTPTVLDWLPMNDGSSTVPVRVSPPDFYKTIIGLDEKVLPSSADYVVLYSTADAASRRVDLANLGLAFGGVPSGGTTGQALFKASDAPLDAEWGALPLVGGGTGTSLTASSGGIVYSTDSQLEILAGTPTPNRIVLSGASSAPVWSTATYPATIPAGSILVAEIADTIMGTPTPVLGVSGSVGGSIAFAGAASGSVLIVPQAAAGTVTLTLPDVSGTIAASAAAPITLDAITGQIAITGSALTATNDANVTMSFTGTPTTALVHPTDLVLGWAGQLAVGRGGTGLASGTPGGILGFTSAATIASSVSLTANAIILGGGASSLPTPMPSLGTTNEVLHGNAAGEPAWGAVSLADDITGVLGVFNGGTGLTGGTSGGILAFIGPNTIASSPALLPAALVCGGAPGQGPFSLTTLGTTTTVLHGNAAGAPTWGAVSLAADVSGVLAVVNGGTSVTTSTGTGSVVLSNNPTLVTPILGAATGTSLALVGGNLSFATSGDGWVGTATNDNANTGNVGEFVSATTTTAVPLTTAIISNAVSVVLTAGDWDVSGNVVFTFAPTTVVQVMAVAISETSGSTGGSSSSVNSLNFGATSTIVPNGNFTMSTPVTRISIASTTTVFLVAVALFSTSTVGCVGNMRARRAR